MSEINNQLKEALIEALDELYHADDEAHADYLIRTISEVRDDLNLILMTDEYAERYIWSKLRSNSSNVQTLMATTATFVQCIDNIDETIKKFVPAFVPFRSPTQIVDGETFEKAVDHAELEKVLLNNYWLFFLLYASTNKRIINGFLSTMLPVIKAKKRGP